MVYAELKNKVAVVTGGSKGIGTAISERFGKEGMKVVINYHSDQQGAQNAAAAVKQNGGAAVIVQADVGTEEGVKKLVDTAIKNFGDLDVWVNNAGMEN